MSRAGGNSGNVIPIAGGDDAFGAIGAALDRPQEAPAMAQEGDLAPFGGRDEDDGLDRPLLPADSPVVALGMKGQTCYYLDVQGQMIGLNPRDHGKNNITALFSPKTHLPMKYWPRWSEPKTDKKTGEVIKASEIVGFKQDEASEALIWACGRAGIFDDTSRVRGRGAHEGRGGALILHLGDKLLIARRKIDGSRAKHEYRDPGLLDGYVYPADEATPRPAIDPAGEEAGEQLLGLLQTWNWSRPLLDPMLALGWAGQAYICGALGWRSHVYVTGGKGTGKSTLNGKGNLFDQLLGRAVMRTASATEAAIRQKLLSKTIPVIFDEFEPNELNPQKTKAIIELARAASSGDEIQKGGQDHKAQEFMLFSAFQFSSILMPEMQPQDRSRFAVLELKPLAADTPRLDLEAHKLPELGRRLMRRMADGWPRLKETLLLYQDALEAVGHTRRGQDQYGTLLACADLLLYDHVPGPELVAQWAQHCAPDGLAELVQTVEEHDACMTRLVTSAVQARGGDVREPISTWVARAERDELARGVLVPGQPVERAVERDRLQTFGLKLVNLRETAKGAIGAVEYRRGRPGYLAIANDHVGLASLFRDTRWASGAWTQALGRVEGAVRGVKVKFAGRSMWATCVPIGDAIELDAGAEQAE